MCVFLGLTTWCWMTDRSRALLQGVLFHLLLAYLSYLQGLHLLKRVTFILFLLTCYKIKINTYLFFKIKHKCSFTFI